jgi:NADH-quinone oxidoreductase subunit J
MTTRPRLATNVNYVNGIAALALFAVLAYVFVTAGLEPPRGFGEGSVVASIGYAMFDMVELVPDAHGNTEGFLVAFLTIAVVLDAALDGAVMLARRDDEGGSLQAATDGGRPVDDTSTDATVPDAATDEPGTDAETGGGEP